MVSQTIQSQIEELCLSEGFSKVGFAKITELENESEYLKQWIEAGNDADMTWIKNSFDKRINPILIDSKIKSVISLAFVYDTPVPHSENNNIPKISRYAWGKRDYHKVLKKKLKVLVEKIEHIIPGYYFRFYVDDGPVMDKVWAVRSGIGWMGKHTNVINPEFGSFFFIANIFTDMEFKYSEKISDLCKDCMICINDCPTGAIYDEYKLDARKCISYQTIENRADNLPDNINLSGWVFGCDICQDVCPYNKHNHFTTDDNFYPREEILSKTNSDYLSMTEEQFNKLFEGTPVRRTKYKGFRRNVEKVFHESIKK